VVIPAQRHLLKPFFPDQGFNVSLFLRIKLEELSLLPVLPAEPIAVWSHELIYFVNQHLEGEQSHGLLLAVLVHTFDQLPESALSEEFELAAHYRRKPSKIYCFVPFGREEAVGDVLIMCHRQPDGRGKGQFVQSLKHLLEIEGLIIIDIKLLEKDEELVRQILVGPVGHENL
jgi:hypothetical protein